MANILIRAVRKVRRSDWIDALRAEVARNAADAERELGSLREQLAQREKDRADVSRLRDSENLLRDSEIQQLKQSLTEQRDIAEELVRRLDAAQVQLDGANERVGAVASERDAHAAALADLASEIAAVRREHDQALAEAFRQSESVGRLASSFEALSTRAAGDLSSIRSELAAARGEADALRNEYNLRGAELEAATGRLFQLETELGQAREREGSLESAIAVADVRFEAVARERDSLLAECARLGASETSLIAERGALRQQAGSPEPSAPAEVPVVQSVADPRIDALVLAEERRRASDRLVAPACLISTLPRSGTWLVRYFLNFFDHYLTTAKEPNISDIYRRVAEGDQYLLEVPVAGFRKRLIAVSHWMCPGVFALPAAKTRGFTSLLRGMNILRYHSNVEEEHAGYFPTRSQSKIVYVFRNPLDVYRSYAEIHERRMSADGRKVYPFNEMVPFPTELFNKPSEHPFEDFIAGLEDTNFAEYFAAQLLSFVLVKEAYPDRVTIKRFEEERVDRERYFTALLASADIDPSSDPLMERAFRKALKATTYKNMTRYETDLGHPLSGPVTFYGETNNPHISPNQRNWKTVYSEEQVVNFKEAVLSVDMRLAAYLPEFFEQQKPIKLYKE